MRIWVFDPGNTTGYAQWNTEKSNLPILFGEGPKKEVFDLLSNIGASIPKPDYLVFENYRIRIDPKAKGFNHRFDTVPAARIIGAIELRAHQIGIEIVSQESSALKVGAGYGGIPVPKGHIKDHLSAMAHGFYFLVKRGVIQPIGQQKKS